MLRYDVISIGCMQQNRYLGGGEAPAARQADARPSHATVTLLRDDDACILVDPSLPGPLLEQLLHDRVGVSPGDVDAVFLTTFRPIHRRGIELFDDADWLIAPPERAWALEHLTAAVEAGGDDAAEAELVMAGRLKNAPDQLSSAVSLFPSPGASAGSAALLLTPPTVTIAVAGDAVVHADYFFNGAAWEGAADVERARESLTEIVEIADLIIPGHDNLLFNPRGRFF